MTVITGITKTIGTVNNAIGTANSIIGAVANTANAVGNLLGDLSGNGSGGDSGSAIGSWIDQLSPASWRGLPFAVDSTQDSAGRRVAIHTYPYRPDVWAEDMGQAPSAFSLSGFVVGDDCYAQAIALRNASIQAGSGTLVHPWLGTVTVAQVSPPKMSVRKDLGRVVQIDFEFVQTGSSVYPSVVTDTGGAVDDAADDLDDAAGESFGDQIADAVQVGTSIVQQGASIAQAAVNTVAGVVSNVESAVQDASLVVHAVAGLPAAVNMNFGRFADGARSTLLTGINTVDGAIAAVSQARSAVSNAVATVNAAANSL